MGQQKDPQSVRGEVPDALMLKEAGNEAYKKDDLIEALACYTKGKLNFLNVYLQLRF